MVYLTQLALQKSQRGAANLKRVSGILQAEASRGDERLGVGVGLLHGLAVDLEAFIHRLAQELFDQSTELVALAPVGY